VWGFGDVIGTFPKPSKAAKDPEKVWYQYINKTGGYINYGDDGLQRLDYLVSACERYGLKLVLPFVNYWGDWGGVGKYIEVFSPNAWKNWFSIPKAQEVYHDYIKVIVTRYRTSPAIFSWQLMNEPRCEGCDYSVITNWATTTSQLIKSLDPDHMVCIGDEGWLLPKDNPKEFGPGYNGDDGIDWAANLRIPTIDYGTFHLYPDLWSYDYPWGSQWIAEHDAIGAKVSDVKPFMLTCQSHADHSCSLASPSFSRNTAPIFQTTTLLSTRPGKRPL
jgi:mannan endo-1,4-beta-mannosidase